MKQKKLSKNYLSFIHFQQNFPKVFPKGMSQSIHEQNPFYYNWFLFVMYSNSFSIQSRGPKSANQELINVQR